MFLAMSGRIGGYDVDPSKPYIDAYAAGKAAFGQFKNTPNTKDRIRQVANRWIEIMTSEFNVMFQRDPDGFFNAGQRDNLIVAIFGGAPDNGGLVAYAVWIQYYFSVEGDMPKTTLVPHLKPYIVPWTYDPTAWLWVTGSPDKAGVIEFMIGQSPRAVVAQSRLRQTITATAHPDTEALTLQSAVQSAVDWAVYKNLVGGPVDMLELRNGGTIHWIQRKKECDDK
jgi:hypothetical protein